jgi:AcrR family transcriptional regulator
VTAALEETPPLNGHERRRAATREKVLAAARALVEEKGREELTVVAAAARAGVSEGTVYKIFSSRDDLAAAATLSVSEDWIEAVAATPSTHHPLRRIHRAHVHMLRELPEEEALLRNAASRRANTTTELGLRYQAHEMIARSCAAGLTRSPRSKLSHDDAVLWSQVYVAAMRTLRMRADDLDLTAQIHALKTSVDTIIS